MLKTIIYCVIRFAAPQSYVLVNCMNISCFRYTYVYVMLGCKSKLQARADQLNSKVITHTSRIYSCVRYVLITERFLAQL